jgi:hypothetical protein
VQIQHWWLGPKCRKRQGGISSQCLYTTVCTLQFVH